GVEIKNSELGLLGHSDADIIIHTIMDALLGAAGEPDIGTLFPAADRRYKDADSMKLLKKIVKLLHDKGWRIEWIDVALNTQTPRLGDMVIAFEDSLSSSLKEECQNRNINIKIKSGEECGSVGRAECMICHAVATISKLNNTIMEEN
ncbi:MAG: 2-C-methyl-D-erythritol 2,4-cyclodiphosphate synthase, partial [Synergistaceae bacterium]|nr:2-C-methyl-D-erythritol 2,4-cyclodiphosphate synthase [Synergistaceae bacterium]